MSRLDKVFLGRWRIDHMDDYDRDYLDLVEPAFIRFERDGSGEFVFGAVSGQLDCRYDKDGVAFTWQGQDEMDNVSGRGHAQQKLDGTIAGQLYRHLGDDSGFTASKEQFFRSLLDLRAPGCSEGYRHHRPCVERLD